MKTSDIQGTNIAANPTRQWIVIVCLLSMAPFMAMMATVIQAGNRRFTTLRSRGAGFNVFYLFANIGAAGGGLLIDLIYLRLGLPHFHVFTFGVGIGMVSLIVMMLTIRRTDQLRGDEEEAILTLTDGPRSNRSGAVSVSPLGILRAVVEEPTFRRLLLLITLLLGVRAGFTYISLLYPKFWYRVIGPDAQVGLLQAFNPILIAIGLLFLIPVLQKFDLFKMLVFGALLSSLAMFILAIPPPTGSDLVAFTYGTTVAFLIVFTVGEVIWSPRLYEYTAAIAPVGQEGTYLGLSMVPYFFAKLVVSGLSGKMLERWVPAPPDDDPLRLQKAIAAGEIPYAESPYMMLLILATAALVGTLIAIACKRLFTNVGVFATADSVTARSPD